MFDDKGVEIILRDPKDRHECGRISYQLQMLLGTPAQPSERRLDDRLVRTPAS